MLRSPLFKPEEMISKRLVMIAVCLAATSLMIEGATSSFTSSSFSFVTMFPDAVGVPCVPLDQALSM